MRKLYVMETTREEVTAKWGIGELPTKGNYDFVRCNAKGEINWEKALVYSAKELVGRDNVIVLNAKGKS